MFYHSEHNPFDNEQRPAAYLRGNKSQMGRLPALTSRLVGPEASAA